MNKPELRTQNELDAIEDLIPGAMMTATIRVKALGKQMEVRPGAGLLPFNWDFWTEFFHAEMLRLREENGLR